LKGEHVEVECVTVRARLALKPEERGYWSVTKYVRPPDDEEWLSIGVGDTALNARGDLVVLLEEQGIPTPTLNECRNPSRRRRLIWSAKCRAMLLGLGAVVVDEDA
jgi:hypothetical protein